MRTVGLFAIIGLALILVSILLLDGNTSSDVSVLGGGFILAALRQFAIRL